MEGIMSKKEYFIVFASDHKELMQEVQKKLKEGWKTKSGAIIFKSPQGSWRECYQTMTRKLRKGTETGE